MKVWKWWTALGFVMAIVAFLQAQFDGYDYIRSMDSSYISFVIIALTAYTILLIGWRSYKVRNYKYAKMLLGDTSKLWFYAESCLSLGMLGTVWGFMHVLTAAFSHLDVSNPASMQHTITAMAVGGGTALMTTFVGMICERILKYMLVNLEEGFQ